MDKAVEKTGLVIKALRYARKHKLDINNKDDVKKILESLDSLHTSEKEVEEFMKLLQDSRTFIGIMGNGKIEKSNLPN